ncbi:MAG: hypothetical protein H7Z72_06810 [Bacteroidetes bacterium]|nr:hypothetical protein [Fibrella sp.]
MRCRAQRCSDETHIETWVGHFSGYCDWRGLLVPTRIEAAWVISGEEKPYARFILRDIEFDQPYAY